MQYNIWNGIWLQNNLITVNFLTPLLNGLMQGFSNFFAGDPQKLLTKSRDPQKNLVTH